MASSVPIVRDVGAPTKMAASTSSPLSASIASLPSISTRSAVSPVTPLSSSRSEEHTSELQSLMRISYAVFCLKKKTTERITSQLAHTTRTNHINTSTHSY